MAKNFILFCFLPSRPQIFVILQYFFRDFVHWSNIALNTSNIEAGYVYLIILKSQLKFTEYWVPLQHDHFDLIMSIENNRLDRSRGIG